MLRRLPLLLALLLAAGIAFLSRPLLHLYSAYGNDVRQDFPPAAGALNDAGHLSETPIDSVIALPPDSIAAVMALQAALRNAAATGRRISIGGARHSMGGQSLFPHSLYVDMRPYRGMELDTAAGILHVGAGAIWAEVIAYLDGFGRSVAVMQGNSNFSVGGSLSVNCHGWQPDHAPIASTVAAFTLFTADGRLRRCSRDENPELFSLALGGYGLFGVILDVDLRVVANEAYAYKRIRTSAAQYADQYSSLVADNPAVGLAHGRLDISHANFLDEALLKYFVRLPEVPAHLGPPNPRIGKLVRAVFQGSAGSEYGKSLRWTLEKRLEPRLFPRAISRNQILSADAEVLANHSGSSVDILQEYFLPERNLEAFIGQLREAVPAHPGVDLLNITVRAVRKDADTFLRYAREDIFGLVLSFRIQANEEGDNALAETARDLIERALALDGTFYLPYRLHATADQVKRAYPDVRPFFEAKRKYDPDEIFQNGFYQQYGRAF